MSNTRINKPEDVLSIGQEVEARVKQVQPNQRRITLSLKSAQQDREVRETRTAIREVNERATRGDGGDGAAMAAAFVWVTCSARSCAPHVIVAASATKTVPAACRPRKPLLKKKSGMKMPMSMPPMMWQKT
jgi:hypothetical protein